MTPASELPASRGGLRDEAADWFAIMRGPDAETRRAEFEAWLDAHAIHREAYNRIAETFSLGKALKGLSPDEQVIDPAARSGKAKAPRTAWVAAMLLIAAAAAAMVWSALRQNQAFMPRPQLAQSDGSQQRLVSRVGEIRKFRLSDGSVATLDTDSLVLVSYRAGSRNLILAQGRARFEVAHDGRPFVVAAEHGSVTAVGTVFDVALGAGGRVDVRLLKGVVDVATAPRTSNSALRRLSAGESLSFGGTEAPVLTKVSAAADTEWPAGLRSFNGVRLADVLADANRYGVLELRAEGPAVAELRISGTFRIDNPRQLSANVAEVLGLAQVTKGCGIVLVRSCPANIKETGAKDPGAKENCVPPS